MAIKFALPFILMLSLVLKLYAQEEAVPVRSVITYQGVEREYFVQKPQNFDPDKRYWLMVVVHGGGGNGSSYWLATGIKKAMIDLNMEALIVTPSFSNTDSQSSRFPKLGEGAFLELVIDELHKTFRLHKKILLTGYSRGGQFAHRFAMQHPDLVKACAAFSAGTWTTPDGKLLMESLEEIQDPESFLSDKSNALLAPERLKGMFESRVAKVAGTRAKKGAVKIPFLVMCGTLDPRLDISKQFANSLEINGYVVQTAWPKTPHVGRSKYPEEFQKYAMGAVVFFSQVTGE